MSSCTKPSRSTKIKAGFVYAIKDTGMDRIKIGHGIDVSRRMKQLQTGNSTKLQLYAFRYFDDRYCAEAKIHEVLAGYREGGEWFRFDRQGKHLLDLIFGKETPTEYEREHLKRLEL